MKEKDNKEIELPLKQPLFLRQRKERLNMVMKYMTDQKTIDYAKLAAAIEILIGVSRKVAHGYIDTLKDFGYVRVEDCTVILNEKEAKKTHDQG